MFEGISRVAKIENLSHLFKMWAHESFRIFSDRLIEDEDLKKFE